MEVVRRYWLTGLSLVLGTFLVFLALAFAVANDITNGERVAGGLVAGVPAVALLGGLWYLRKGGLPVSVCLFAIAIGLIGVAIWWWMLLPPVLALVILWFGVVRGGLVKELRPVS